MTSKNALTMMSRLSARLILAAFILIAPLFCACKSKAKLSTEVKRDDVTVAQLQSIAASLHLDWVVYDSVLELTPTDTSRRVRVIRGSLTRRDTTTTADTLCATRLDSTTILEMTPSPIAAQSIKKRGRTRSAERNVCAWCTFFTIFFVLLLFVKIFVFLRHNFKH